MKKAALLVVDVQQDLADAHPYREKTFFSGIQRLISFCRAEGIEVLYVRHDDGPGASLHAGNPGWQIAQAVAPLPGETVFDKRYNSAFLKTGLESHLKQKEVDTLILTGLQTEYCIDATCKSAFEHGFSVILPEGCTSTFDSPLLTAEQLCVHYRSVWDGRFGLVLPVEEVLSRLEGCTF